MSRDRTNADIPLGTAQHCDRVPIHSKLLTIPNWLRPSFGAPEPDQVNTGIVGIRNYNTEATGLVMPY